MKTYRIPRIVRDVLEWYYCTFRHYDIPISWGHETLLVPAEIDVWGRKGLVEKRVIVEIDLYEREINIYETSEELRNAHYCPNCGRSWAHCRPLLYIGAGKVMHWSDRDTRGLACNYIEGRFECPPILVFNEYEV